MRRLGTSHEPELRDRDSTIGTLRSKFDYLDEPLERAALGEEAQVAQEGDDDPNGHQPNHPAPRHGSAPSARKEERGDVGMRGPAPSTLLPRGRAAGGGVPRTNSANKREALGSCKCTWPTVMCRNTGD